MTNSLASTMSDFMLVLCLVCNLYTFVVGSVFLVKIKGRQNKLLGLFLIALCLSSTFLVFR
jgi:hypothetical protein